MTTEPGLFNVVRNLVLGSIYAFSAIFFSIVIIGVLVVGISDDTAPDTIAEADTGTTDPTADQAAENEVSDADAETTVEEREQETEAATEPVESESDTRAEAVTDGGVDAAPSEAAAPADTTASDTAEYDGDMSPELMEFALESEMGLDVEVYDQNGLILVDYTSTAATETELAENLGGISGAYAALVGDGYPTDGMTIYVYDVDGTNVGYVDVDAADAQAYMDGEITDEQYAERVLAGLVAY